ncbi:hypothetical protein SGFS_002910 [Streptomyces graminofaciens]|uniref:Uncharacterized protein n=1 Tax=Streptomyces graminofaciens TaxID=68212 RepID=A0ABN5V8L1_9ACTN|nr:hypothetical protein [Streptomyces graminofaciens]BBC29000.1 hypothetical protein SGFS_002910 [Streptomyces graminofaciens]
MFQETPIFSRLVAERGDVPAQVRGEAERIRRDLARVLRQAPVSSLNTPRNAAGPTAPSTVL